MILPTTALAGLLLMILALTCWGTWGNTLKLAGKWRYELYFFDFSIGLMICVAIAALTFGSLNSAELTFQDNFLIASGRKLVFAAGAGILFTIANVLLIAGMSVVGMAVSFFISLGLATVIAAGWDFAFDQSGSPFLLFGGVILLLAAIVAIAFAQSSHADARLEAERKSALQIDPRSKKAPKNQGPTAALGIAMSVVSGIFMGLWVPVLETVRDGENGVSSYGTAVLFGAGALFAAALFSPFVINFPASGEPVTMRSYFTSTAKQHLLGLLGGIVWGAGAVAAWVVARSVGGAQVSAIARYSLDHGAPVLAALFGLLAWGEFRGASDRVRALLWITVILYLIGLGLIATSGFAGAK